MPKRKRGFSERYGACACVLQLYHAKAETFTASDLRFSVLELQLYHAKAETDSRRSSCVNGKLLQLYHAKAETSLYREWCDAAAGCNFTMPKRKQAGCPGRLFLFGLQLYHAKAETEYSSAPI